MENKHIKKEYMASMLSRDLILELLEKNYASLKMALLAMDNKDFETSNHCLIDCENILLEFQSMLREEEDATARTYDFFDCLAEELFYINLNKDRQRLEEVLQISGRLVSIYSEKVGK